jgi:hypothetical protein
MKSPLKPTRRSREERLAALIKLAKADRRPAVTAAHAGRNAHH